MTFATQYANKISLFCLIIRGAICAPFLCLYWNSPQRPPLIPYIPTLYLPNHFHLPFNSIGMNLTPLLVNSIPFSYISYEFNSMPKRKIKPIPLHLQDTDKARKAISWAFRSYLRAYPVPSGDMYHIEIDNGLKRIKSPQTYKKEELTDALWRIYIKYYDNHLEKVGYES